MIKNETPEKPFLSFSSTVSILKHKEYFIDDCLNSGDLESFQYRFEAVDQIEAAWEIFLQQRMYLIFLMLDINSNIKKL